GEDGSAPFLCRDLHRKPVVIDNATIEEERSMAMLYRDYREFAVAHGVGVHAVMAPGQPERAERLETRVIPSYEVPATEMPTPDEVPALGSIVLDMRLLAEMDRDALVDNFYVLAGAYRVWIAERWEALEVAADLREL